MAIVSHDRDFARFSGVRHRLPDRPGEAALYDGAYVALAETLTGAGVPLLTADARLARAVRAHDAFEVLLAAWSLVPGRQRIALGATSGHRGEMPAQARSGRTQAAAGRRGATRRPNRRGRPARPAT